MGQAIDAYREVTATDSFRELERTRHYAEHNRATELHFAKEEGYRNAEEKWQGVVAEKDMALAEQRNLIEELRSQLNESSQ